MRDRICPIIRPDELLELQSAANLLIFDASNHPGARTNFAKRHLAGATFVDINSQLADIKSTPADGGRHPLPSPVAFASTLSSLGVSPGSQVVVYDDKSGANAAARFWWMLRAVGHENVRVLDGGIEAAIRAGFPIEEGLANSSQGDYRADSWTLPLADIDEVENASANGGTLIIDVRESPRYNGETEPFDKIAGHIPNAINIPFAENLDDDGCFLSPEILRSKYEREFAGREDIIVHCGSGVTACHTLLALDYAGIEMPKLFVGSWSEWSSRGLPVATVAR